ncbi:hypothetical protein ACO0K0_07090 [Undibacterium sp. SXout11W]|uniref:hypothetical protein n=1 Tax=Undibacterium sp. SXout11W TaxID=3413050 RepID=UPI003BF11BB1
MKRINGLDKAADLFGAGKDGFKSEVPGVSLASEVTAVWFNGVQEAVVRTIEAAGLALSEADFDQFTNAIQTLITNKVNAVVNAAPGALDTLKELADAIGDDPNFAMTMTNALATKETRFPLGTRLVFAQAAAPVGWTQDVSDAADNRMLRVVKTAGNGSGGAHSPILNSVVPAHTHGFTTGNNSADHTHMITDPGHSHAPSIGGQFMVSGAGGGINSVNGTLSTYTGGTTTANATTNISILGASTPHTHSGSTDNGSSSTNWQPRYIDLIICTRN